MDKPTPTRPLNHPTALTRLLPIAALAAITAACGATQTPRHRHTPTATDRHPTPALRSGPLEPHAPAVVIAAATSTSTTPPSSARGVALAFAAAYGRYLQDQLPAARLPDCSPAAQATITAAGPLPTHLHAQLQLRGIHGGPQAWTAQYAMTVPHRHDTLAATIGLEHAASGWEITSLVPPDPDEILAPSAPPNTPPAPPAATTAANAFTTSWLAYTYGHATAHQLRDLTTTLRASLAANPPQAPPAIRALHPRITNLTLERDTHHTWIASAAITDGENSYTVIIALTSTHDHWLATRIIQAG